jgi:putative transposase
VARPGDRYDNALSETIIGLYKTELVRRRGPWRGLDDVELATLKRLWWLNHDDLLSSIGQVPSVEFEQDLQPHHPPVAGAVAPT